MTGTHAGFRTTLDLYEAGVSLMRQNLRRQHPGEAEAEIDLRMQRWLRERPGAEDGDCPGRRVDIDARLG